MIKNGRIAKAPAYKTLLECAPTWGGVSSLSVTFATAAMQSLGQQSLMLCLCRVKLRGITYSLPGLHILKCLCLTDSICRTTTLKDKLWWKDLYFLGLILSGFCQSVAPFPLCPPSRWMCLCLTFCLVLSLLCLYLPVVCHLAFGLLSLEVGERLGFLLDFAVVVCVFLAAFFSSYCYQASWLLLWGKRVPLAIPGL